MTDVATMGDNLPPDDANPLRDRLAEDYAGLETRKNELLEEAKRVPATVDDMETAGKVGDFIKKLTTHAKNADGIRIKEKEEYLEGGRNVDGFFGRIIEPLKATKKESRTV